MDYSFQPLRRSSCIIVVFRRKPWPSQGRYGEAERLLRRAMMITERALGTDHRDYSTIISRLVHVLEEQVRCVPSPGLLGSPVLLLAVDTFPEVFT